MSSDRNNTPSAYLKLNLREPFYFFIFLPSELAGSNPVAYRSTNELPKRLLRHVPKYQDQDQELPPPQISPSRPRRPHICLHTLQQLLISILRIRIQVSLLESQHRTKATPQYLLFSIRKVRQTSPNVRSIVSRILWTRIGKAAYTE